MIDIKTKIHDRYSVEFKLGFVTRRKLRENDFCVDMWIFVPSSLDINSQTYTKNDFYRDVKSNIRLITPRYLLRDLVDGKAEPFCNLRRAAGEMASSPTRTNVAAYEYEIKMFAAMVKSALRDATDHIVGTGSADDAAALIDGFASSTGSILDKYYSLLRIINTPSSEEVVKTFDYCGEFICNIAAQHVLKIISYIDGMGSARLDAGRGRLVGLVNAIKEIRRRRGYAVIVPDSAEGNSRYLMRQGSLKKLVESQLYLNVPKKKDGRLAEQVYFSLAAGLAMIFATVVAWAFQKTFGNLTWPLFLALIISYMLKDRIKELMRYYFARKVGGKYFDNKAKICFGGRELGWMKEAMSFIATERIPKEITDIRSKNPVFDADTESRNENVILYVKKVHIDRDKLEEGMTYEFSGVNDIIRVQFDSFMRKMDNPEAELPYIDDDDLIQKVACPRLYCPHIVLKYKYDDVVEYKHFRLYTSRDGIDRIEEIK